MLTTRICGVRVAYLALLTAGPLHAQSRGRLPNQYAIVQQAKELRVILQAYGPPDPESRKTFYENAQHFGVNAEDADLVLAFAADPLCRRHSGWCQDAFSPFDKSKKKLLTPSADLIHSLAVAETPITEAVQQGFADQLGSKLTPTAYTAFAGISDYVVTRAKDAAVVTFALDLRQRIASDDVLSRLLSQTLTATADMDSRSVKELLPALRTGFTHDLDSLPLRLMDQDVLRALLPHLLARVKTKPDSDRVIKAFSTIEASLPPAIAIGKRLAPITKGTNALDAIASFETIAATDVPQVDIRSSLITVGIVAREYRANPDGLKSLIRDPLGRELFLGLFYRDVALDLCGTTAGCFSTIDAWLYALGTAKQGSIIQLVAASDDIAIQLTDLRTQISGATSGKAGVGASAIVRMANEVVGLVEPFINADNSPTWTNIQQLISETNAIQEAVAAKQYVTVAVRAAVFVQQHLSVTLPARYSLTLNTAAAFATAQTPEEVAAVLETSAEPVLSFRAKRTISPEQGRTLFGINAYAGFGGGSENAFAKGAQGSSTGYSGVALPIGPEWSVANGTGSISVFAPLIDLGTIASFRLSSNETTQNTPNVTLGQIIAPGLYGVIGITQRYPISIGLGAQYVGALRKTESGKSLNVVRAGAWIGIDVPLYHF